MSQPYEESKTFMQKVLDVVERVGNKVPHPAVIFLILIAIVILLLFERSQLSQPDLEGRQDAHPGRQA